MKPIAAIAITASSRLFTQRMKRARSILSASWPAVAEKSRKGAMKTAPMTKPAVALSPPPQLAA
jgi:hypothetical protein